MGAHKADNPGPSETLSVDEGVAAKFPPMSCTILGKTYRFGIDELEEECGIRLVLRERPNRAGVKIDSTGAAKKAWQITATFANNATTFEDGLDASPVYPDLVDALLDAFERSAFETFDAVIPTKGKRRVRAYTWKRKDAYDPRDCAVVTFTLIEDNEDDVDATAVDRMTVKGSGETIVQKAQFDAESIGAWNGTLSGLLESIREVQGILNLPETFTDDVLSNTTALSGTIKDLLATFSEEAEDARSMFTDPSSSRFVRRAIVLLDMLPAARTESNGKTQRQTTGRAYARDYSIFDIASLEKQDANDLMELNQYRIEDMYRIPAGSVVLVYA